MALCADLSEAFFNSLIYWMWENTDLDADFGDRMYLSHPDLNLSLLTLPFITINFYSTEDDIWAQPDIAYRTAVDPNYDPTLQVFESRLIKYNFTIGVYCETYAQQRDLPYLVKREIEQATTVEGGLTKDGIQVYKGFDSSGDPDADSELCVAEPILGGPFPLGGEEEETTLKNRSMIDGYWETSKDKTKVFISTDL